MSLSKPTIDKSMDTTERDALLSIQDLHVWFELRKFGFAHAGYVRAVDGVDFDLHAGEAIAIVGESGCGKSSLMKTILGLNKPTNGNVFFDNTNLNSLNRSALKNYRSKLELFNRILTALLPPFYCSGHSREPLMFMG